MGFLLFLQDLSKMKLLINKASLVFLLMPFFFSCRTYRNAVDVYYNHLQAGQYKEAGQDLNKIKLLKKKRNRLLFNLEAGAVQYKLNNYQKSNEYLNTANDFLESNYKSFKDVAVSNVVNPMMETYRGEPFEPFMVNFYKAINYINLGLMDDAVVEARKITLESDQLVQKYKENTSRYNKDAFALNLQGIIYEAAGEINNAFVSYRNAVNIYLDKKGSYYGVEMPKQLKQDLLRTANQMGFVDEQRRYEELLNEKLSDSTSSSALVLFLEEGTIPVKDQYSFTIIKAPQSGGYQYINENGSYINFPFQPNRYGVSDDKVSVVNMARIALPVYKTTYNKQVQTSISVNGTNYFPEKTQDFNKLTFSVLQERFLEDLAKAFARYLFKSLLGNAIPSADNKKKENDKEKKEDNIGKVMFGLAGAFSEKADTRSWISLPAYIHYVRFPLQEGSNTIEVNSGNASQVINVNGKKGIQIKSIAVN